MKSSEDLPLFLRRFGLEEGVLQATRPMNVGFALRAVFNVNVRQSHYWS